MAQMSLKKLYHETKRNNYLESDKIHLTLATVRKSWNENTSIDKTSKKYCGYVSAKSVNQETYLNNINNNDITFAIGPSGTGKTFLAAAVAVDALLMNEVKRIT